MVKGLVQNNDLIYNDSLNSKQIEAVRLIHGPMLVLAGAGTGKTKVIVHKIAHLINSSHAREYQILGLTFSIKAAEEMKKRVLGLLKSKIPENAIKGMWINTFHSISLRILQSHDLNILGYQNEFNVIDEKKSLTIIKKVIDGYGIIGISEKIAYDLISKFKDKLYKPDTVPDFEVENYRGIKTIFREYQANLLENNYMDFADLIFNVIQLFHLNKEICIYYQNKFKYIFVDEYQDTSFAQYALLRVLAQKYSNLCCVGDDDQAIYSWRNASYQHILKFEKDFPNSQVLYLNENYRSTENIINIANNLISKNFNRYNKNLVTTRGKGNRILLHIFQDEMEEANYISLMIKDVIQKYNNERKNVDIAILLRAGHQMRIFEEKLTLHNIKHRIIGGMRFYDRKEIKDIISYINLILNHNDDDAFENIINVPKRYIGSITLDKIKQKSRYLKVSLFETCHEIVKHHSLPNHVVKELEVFIKQMNEWKNLLKSDKYKDASELLNIVISNLKYIEYLENEYDNKANDKVENIKELLSNLKDFKNLEDFILHVNSMSQDNAIEKNIENYALNIMTMHAAKGLEFDTVFLPSWIEGIFPSTKTLNEFGIDGLEEERRLGYVSVTRAKNNLHISLIKRRKAFNSYDYLDTVASRFISEIGAAHYTVVNHTMKNYDGKF